MSWLNMNQTRVYGYWGRFYKHLESTQFQCIQIHSIRYGCTCTSIRDLVKFRKSPYIPVQHNVQDSILQWPVNEHSIMCARLCSTVGRGINIFDRKSKQIQKDRAYLDKKRSTYEYLKDEVGYRIYDRICDVDRYFPLAMDLGCGRGYVSKHLHKDMVGYTVLYDVSLNALEHIQSSKAVASDMVLADEEFLTIRPSTVDIVFSSLSLHWVNDLPWTFKQIHKILKDDGCFIGAMFSGDTLYELRVSLQLAETEREGGFAPHVSPFTAAQDLGRLLQRAGYVMITIDYDDFVIRFPTMFEMMHDLKGMGENNASWLRRSMIPRDTLLAAASIYKEMYGGNGEGIPATFQVLYFIAWKPHPSQQEPAGRGSGNISIKDIGKLDQLSQKFKKLKDD